MRPARTSSTIRRRYSGAYGGFWIEGYGGRSETDAASGAGRMTADRRGAVFGVDALSP